MEFDPFALFTNTSPAIAFGLLAFWFNRRDHADMLRREQAYSAQMAILVERMLQESEKRTEAITQVKQEMQANTKELHSIKNVVQQLIARVDPQWRDASRRTGDN